MINHTEQELLDSGLKALGLENPLPLLADYLCLLQKWNKAYNLTSIRDFPTMITKHILDSLAVTSWIKGEALLDVGTGAGLPGIPLAIAFPQLKVTLIDSNGKKIRFLEEVKRQLHLNNISLYQSRVEDFEPEARFDTVISRALTELEQFVQWTGHLMAPQGRWIAMKGHQPDVELQRLNRPYQLFSYTVPHLDSERCCIIIDN